MLKWERKIIEYVERNLQKILYVFFLFFLLFSRRGTLYQGVFDIEATVVPVHVGFYHTAPYRLLLEMIFRVPLWAVQTSKIVVAIFDFCVAVLGAVISHDVVADKKQSIMPVLCYGMLIMSPLVIAYGSMWNHMDCVAMSLVMLAYVFLRRGNDKTAMFLLGTATSLFTVYWLFVPWFVQTYEKRKKRKMFCLLIATWGILLLVSGVIYHLSPFEVLCSVIDVIIKDPITGTMYTNLGACLLTLILRMSYVVGIATLLNGLVGTRLRKLSVAVHVILICFVGLVLQYGYFYR